MLRRIFSFLFSDPYSRKLPCPRCARTLTPVANSSDLHCPRCHTFYTTTHDLDYFDMPLNFRITGSYAAPQKKELSRAAQGQP